MRELSIVLLHLVEYVLVCTISVFLGSLVGFSMGVCFLWGGIPASPFSEVFVASVGRFIGRLLCGTPVGGVVGV